MFDIGFFELVLLAIVGLLVLGPERLPHAIRMGSAYLGKIRRAVMSVREEFEREVNIQEMQQRILDQAEKSGLSEAEDSLKELQKQIEEHHNIGQHHVDEAQLEEPEDKSISKPSGPKDS